MCKRALAVATLLAVASVPAYAGGLDISLSDKTANIMYLTDSGSLGYGGADVGFGGFFNENDDVLGMANLLVTSNPGSGNNIQFGIGAKGYAGNLHDTDDNVGALGIGGLVRYVIPSRTPMGIALEGYVAPRITSFAETKHLYEGMIRFELEVMPSTRGYIGYRTLKPDMENAGKVQLDDEIHVGIRITF